MKSLGTDPNRLGIVDMSGKALLTDAFVKTQLEQDLAVCLCLAMKKRSIVW